MGLSAEQNPLYEGKQHLFAEMTLLFVLARKLFSFHDRFAPLRERWRGARCI
jgi:hypothetical protein